MNKERQKQVHVQQICNKWNMHFISYIHHLIQFKPHNHWYLLVSKIWLCDATTAHKFTGIYRYSIFNYFFDLFFFTGYFILLFITHISFSWRVNEDDFKFIFGIVCIEIVTSFLTNIFLYTNAKRSATGVNECQGSSELTNLNGRHAI